MKIQRTGALVMTVTAMPPGTGMLVFGIWKMAAQGGTGHQETEGALLDSRLAKKGGYGEARRRTTSDTYVLIYEYSAGGRRHQAETDYSTRFVPAIGGAATVRYNPEEAVSARQNRGIFLIFPGHFFSFGSGIIFLRLREGFRKSAKEPWEQAPGFFLRPGTCAGLPERFLWRESAGILPERFPFLCCFWPCCWRRGFF